MDIFEGGTIEFEIIKWPKIVRCKNRKRYKKLLMSIGLERNFADQYLDVLYGLRNEIAEYNPSYQELWDEIRIAKYGF